MIKKDNVLRYLSAKNNISLPQLQQDLSIGYPMAKQIISVLKEKGIVSKSPDGIYYSINKLKVSPIAKGDAECEELARTLTERAMELLGRVYVAGGVAVSVLDNEDNAEHLSQLRSHGVLHEFDGCYYVSLDQNTYQTIRNIGQKHRIANADFVYDIGYSILSKCIDQGYDPRRILNISFIPEECTRFVIQEYDRYNKTGVLPERKPFVEQEADLMKYTLLESLIATRDYDKHSEYLREARRELKMMNICAVCPGKLIEAAEMAVKDIEAELTMANIREIRGIVLSRKKSEDDSSDFDEIGDLFVDDDDDDE